MELIGTARSENASTREEKSVRDISPFVIEDEVNKEDDECPFEEIHNENERIMNEEEKQLHCKCKHECTIASMKKERY